MIGADKKYGETARLVLRSWRKEDVKPFAVMNSDPRVMKWFPAPLTEEETKSFYGRIVNGFERNGWGLYAVELKATGRFAGYVGLHEIGFEASFSPGVEIGWRLAADCHNQGYATEAAEVVLTLARELGMKTLYSFTAVANGPSERVMQKIGMKKAGEFNHPGLPADSPLLRHVLYRIDF